MFDLSNYIFFIILLAIVYTALVNFIQARVGGKGRLAALQKEMREVQLRMIEAGKKGNEKESSDIMNGYWKLTGELFSIQMQMTVIILLVFVALMAAFPHIEPGASDDIQIALYDDGLAAHCDAVAGDSTFSGCLALPDDGMRGAWVVDAHVKSQGNETVSKNGTALYFEGGQPSDIWIQASAQNGFWDGLLGKRPYFVNITTDLGENHTYKPGDIVGVHATSHSFLTVTSQETFDAELSGYNKANQNQVSLKYSDLAAVSREAAMQNGTVVLDSNGKAYPVARSSDGVFAVAVPNMPAGGRMEAVANAGTFFHYDAPFTIPLINIRRIIGSYGVFIFIVFVTSIAYALAKAVYAKLTKKQ